MGNCYGLTLLWFIYLHNGRNLLDEVETIVHTMTGNQKLNTHQLKLLQDVSVIQNNQQHVTGWQVRQDFYLYTDKLVYSQIIEKESAEAGLSKLMNFYKNHNGNSKYNTYVSTIRYQIVTPRHHPSFFAQRQLQNLSELHLDQGPYRLR